MVKKTRSQAALGVALPILGVGIGVCAFTVVLSVMGGFVHGLKSRLLGLESHIEIVVKNGFGRIPSDPTLLLKIPNYSSQILALSPFEKGDAILQSNSRVITVTLLGIDPQIAKLSTGFEKFLERDKDLGVLAKPQPVLGVVPEVHFPAIIVGRDILNMLGVDVGDRITIVSTLPEEGPFGLAPKQYPVVIADSMNTGSATHDAKLAIGSLGLTSSFFGTENEWAGIQVKLKDAFDAEEVAKKLDISLSPLNLRAKPWTESNKALLRALKLERWGMSFVLMMVILVGCFSITITLVLAAKRKSREMAILRAIGFERFDLGALYLLKGFSIGVIGVISGLFVGFIILKVIQKVPIPFLTSAYSGRALPVLIDGASLTFVCVSSVILTVLAALWPALEVMRIDVVETLSDRN